MELTCNVCGAASTGREHESQSDAEDVQQTQPDADFIDDTQRQNSPTLYRALANGNLPSPAFVATPLPFCPAVTDFYVVVLQRNM